MKVRNLFLLPLASALLVAGCTSDSKSNSDTTDGNNAACEGIDLNTSADNCGTCGHKCGDNAVCNGGVCGCALDWYDCDGDNRCESNVACDAVSCENADLDSSPLHCGKCDNKCGANSNCMRGDCLCTDGWYDCDKDAARDCESNVPCGSTQSDCEKANKMTSNQHCGACNHACINAQCDGGICECDKNRADCDGDGNCECLHGTCNAEGKCIADEGYYDCDGNGSYETKGECECTAGQTISCYTGDANDKRGETTRAGGKVVKHRCKDGHLNCVIDEQFGAHWSRTCYDEIHPTHIYSCTEFADNPNILYDADCDGTPEVEQDDDHDNHAICKDGQIDDCCDNLDQCPAIRNEDRQYIHSARIECNGNEVDDNCDGSIDDGPAACGEEQVIVVDEHACEIKDRNCDNALTKDDWAEAVSESASNSGPAALSLLKAMDICMSIGTADSLGEGGGIIEYSLHKSGKDTLAVDSLQVNFLPGMENKDGTVRIPPRTGNNVAMLSSGEAVDVKNSGKTADFERSKKYDYDNDNAEPDYCADRNAVPAVFAKQNEDLTTNSKCKSETNKICDSAVLHLKLKAPKTANGFSFDFRFFSREYPYYVCSQYNDIFLAILTDESGNPIADTNGDGKLDDEDGNIAFDDRNIASNEQKILLSVNSAFFTTCNAPKCGDYYAFSYLTQLKRLCTKEKQCVDWWGNFDSRAWNRNYGNSCTPNITCTNQKCGTCENGGDDLAAYYPSPYQGSGNAGDKNAGNKSGGTAWLTTRAPIEGGQVFNLDFYIWDTFDSAFDSTVILDNFQWLCTSETITVGTDFAKPIEQTN